MYREDGLQLSDMHALQDRFKGQALDFFGALRSSTYDSQIRVWIETDVVGEFFSSSSWSGVLEWSEVQWSGSVQWSGVEVKCSGVEVKCSGVEWSNGVEWSEVHRPKAAVVKATSKL